MNVPSRPVSVMPTDAASKAPRKRASLSWRARRERVVAVLDLAEVDVHPFAEDTLEERGDPVARAAQHVVQRAAHDLGRRDRRRLLAPLVGVLEPVDTRRLARPDPQRHLHVLDDLALGLELLDEPAA